MDMSMLDESDQICFYYFDNKKNKIKKERIINTP